MFVVPVRDQRIVGRKEKRESRVRRVRKRTGEGGGG
jgi:hypothetical protein